MFAVGAPLADVKRLTKHWLESYDWRKAEEELNRLPHFVTDIQCDGFESLAIHFIHVRSKVKGAIPLLFLHGWPGVCYFTSQSPPFSTGFRGRDFLFQAHPGLTVPDLFLSFL